MVAHSDRMSVSDWSFATVVRDGPQRDASAEQTTVTANISINFTSNITFGRPNYIVNEPGVAECSGIDYGARTPNGRTNAPNYVSIKSNRTIRPCGGRRLVDRVGDGFFASADLSPIRPVPRSSMETCVRPGSVDRRSLPP